MQLRCGREEREVVPKLRVCAAIFAIACYPASWHGEVDSVMQDTHAVVRKNFRLILDFLRKKDYIESVIVHKRIEPFLVHAPGAKALKQFPFRSVLRRDPGRDPAHIMNLPLRPMEVGRFLFFRSLTLAGISVYYHAGYRSVRPNTEWIPPLRHPVTVADFAFWDLWSSWSSFVSCRLKSYIAER